MHRVLARYHLARLAHLDRATAPSYAATNTTARVNGAHRHPPTAAEETGEVRVRSSR